jgi:hypothetical protein
MLQQLLLLPLAYPPALLYTGLLPGSLAAVYTPTPAINTLLALELVVLAEGLYYKQGATGKPG